MRAGLVKRLFAILFAGTSSAACDPLAAADNAAAFIRGDAFVVTDMSLFDGGRIFEGVLVVVGDGSIVLVGGVFSRDEPAPGEKQEERLARK